MTNEKNTQEALLERISKLPDAEKQILIKMVEARRMHRAYIDPNMHVRNLLGIKEQK